MYLFVYKTVHKNGRYYIGRHQTENLDDDYLGSGVWVSGIKDKSTLSREIIVEADCFEELCELEEYYIDLHWEDPLCMNKTKRSNGWTSEEVREMNLIRSANGTHQLLKRPDGTSVASDSVKNGTHNFLTRPDGTSVSSDRVKEGSHQFLTRPDGTNVNTDKVKAGTHQFSKRPDGTSFQQDRVKNGTHHLLTRPDGTSVASDRVKAGTHNWLTRPDGTNHNTDRVKDGTNPFLRYKGSVACYNKQGEYERIPKEQFHSQSGPKEDWEWVGITSKEGKRRKLLK